MAIDRRKVTMTSVAARPDNSGYDVHQATDYVAIEHLDTYVADAKTRWQAVTVSDEVDHGPGGTDGAYDITAATTSPEA